MPKFNVQDQLISGGQSFTVAEIEEDLEGNPIYVDILGECFAECDCKRTRKAKVKPVLADVSNLSDRELELKAMRDKLERQVCSGEFRDFKGRNPSKSEIAEIMMEQRNV